MESDRTSTRGEYKIGFRSFIKFFYGNEPGKMANPQNLMVWILNVDNIIERTVKYYGNPYWVVLSLLKGELNVG